MIKIKKRDKNSQNQDVYRDIFNLSESGMVLLDHQGRIVEANETFCQLLHFSEFDLKENNFLDLISSSNKKGDYDKLQEALSSHSIKFKGIICFRQKMGRDLTYSISLSTLSNTQTNKLYRIVTLIEKKSFSTDHPGKIKIETLKVDKMQSWQDPEICKFSTALDQAPSVVVITDLQGKIEYVNHSFTKITGFSAQEAVGQCPRVLKSGHHSEEMYRDLWLSITYGKTWFGEFLNKKKNGNLFWEKASIAPIKNEQGEITHFIKVAEDITHRKEMEQTLAKTEKQLRMLSQAVKQSSSSIIITRMDGTIEYVNPSFTQITGYEYNEVVGKNLSIFKPEDRPTAEYRIIWDSLLKGDVLRGEFCNVKKNNEQYWVLSSMSPIYDEEGKISHYVMINEDITSRKEAESALRISEESLREANATKDKLFSLIGHDLRNAFNIILVGTQVMLDKNNQFDRDKLFDYIRRLHQTSQNTYDLLQNLLTWAQMQMNQIHFNPKEINLRSLGDTTIGLFEEGAREKNIVMYNAIEDNLFAYADREMIDVVIRNLVNNALKFTNSGGTIQILGEQKNHHVTITIADTGMGIDPEHRESIFLIESTYQQRGTSGETGTGMGLPLCREFVEKNNGKIWVESAKDRGSDFKFTLPLKKNN